MMQNVDNRTSDKEATVFYVGLIELPDNTSLPDEPREPDPPPRLAALAEAGDFIGLVRATLEPPPAPCSPEQVAALLDKAFVRAVRNSTPPNTTVSRNQVRKLVKRFRDELRNLKYAGSSEPGSPGRTAASADDRTSARLARIKELDEDLRQIASDLYWEQRADAAIRRTVAARSRCANPGIPR